MRQTICVVVCVLMAGFCFGVNALIPEQPFFQPGSFAVPYGTFQHPATFEAQGAAASETDWERKFSPQTVEPMGQASPQIYEVPYLTYIYDRRTGRFHLTFHEPGFAANPSAFPIQTSPLHIWVSCPSSANQPHPQVQYMCYHDPDPVILPAEIRLRGSRLFAPARQAMPMPLPRPETAVPIRPPARTQLGERVRQNFGAFVVH